MPNNQSEIISFVPQKAVRRRILFADAAPVKFDSLKRWLSKDQFECEGYSDAIKFMERIKSEHIDLCIVNLLMGGVGPFQLIEQIRKESKNQDIRIVVLSKQIHKVNIQNSIRSGANDFVADPFETANLYHRILFQMAPKKEIQHLGTRQEWKHVGEEQRQYLDLLLSTIDVLAHHDRSSTHEIFFNILSELAGLIDSNRTNLVIVEPGAQEGVVMASSDDIKFNNYMISLEKYPEVASVVTTGSIVLVEDVSKNAMTSDIAQAVTSIQIGSLMVFPIYYQDEINGAVTIRRAKAKTLPSMEVLTIIQAIANTLAGHAHTAVALKKIYRNYDAPQAK